MKIQQQKSDFEICPVGQMQAVICDVIDGGWEANEFKGDYKGVRPRMKFVLQTKKADKEGRRFVIFDFFLGISFGKKSNFRAKRLNAILGSDAVADIEASGDFDQEALIGKNVLMSIVHNKSANGQDTYANIDNLMPWSTEFGELIKAEGYRRVENGEKWEDPNPSAFEDITYDEAEVMLYEQGKLPAGIIPKLMQEGVVETTDQPLPAEPKAMAPDPELPLPATTHSPAQGEKERVKGNAKAEHDHQVKEAVKALAKPELSKEQMKAISKEIKDEAHKYEVDIDKVDYDNFEDWKATAQAAVTKAQEEVFD